MFSGRHKTVQCSVYFFRIQYLLNYNLTYQMLHDKQTYFESHHREKKVLPIKKFESHFSSYLLACCSTVLRSLFVAIFACFNISSNSAPENLCTKHIQNNICRKFIYSNIYRMINNFVFNILNFYIILSFFKPSY